MATIPTYGISQKTVVFGELDIQAEELERNGFTVIQNCLTGDLLKKVSDLYDELSSRGVENQQDFLKDRNILRCPLAEHKLFLDVALLPTPLILIERFLGENYVLLMQNAVTSVQDTRQYQAQWHRDLNYQHFVSSQPFAFNFLVALDDFVSEQGATMVLPGSHMYETFPSDAYVLKHQTAIEAPAGSVIVMNAMTFHRTGDHVTGKQTRRAINHVVGRPFLSQQIDIPRYLKEKMGDDYSSDAFLQKYLGYKWNPAANVSEWQAGR